VGGACGANGGGEDHIQVIDRKVRGKRPRGRPRCRWVDNNKMDLVERGWGGVDWTGPFEGNPRQSREFIEGAEAAIEVVPPRET
jgi:hypothetical protein